MMPSEAVTSGSRLVGGNHLGLPTFTTTVPHSLSLLGLGKEDGDKDDEEMRKGVLRLGGTEASTPAGRVALGRD